jgi:uncharacterized protein (DUF1697 family)
MALVVFLRGVNVGGHRTFRPSVLAQELRAFDVVNIGAAGTFIVKKPGPKAKFLAALVRRLPFATEVVVCEGRDLIRLLDNHPFGTQRPGVVRFLTILAKAGRPSAALPVAFPAERGWLVRVITAQRRFVFGEYRRHMKTIGYLGRVDKLFSVPATTRNWNTITSIVRRLQQES